MLTPQEIQEKKFEKARFGGYDMTQIDDFLDLILADYTSLYKENATLKGKMRVLVEKIEEYRAVDEQMRKALYTAQVSARDIVAKAQNEADAILKNANAMAQAQIGDLRSAAYLEEQRLAAAKAACSDYARRISAMLSKNIEVIEHIIEAPAEQLVPQRQGVGKNNVEAAAYANSIQRAVDKRPAAQLDEKDQAQKTRDLSAPPAQADPPPEKEPVRSAQSDEMEMRYFEIDLSDKKTGDPPDNEGVDGSTEMEGDTARIYGDSIFTPKPRFDFKNLKFGANYHEDNDKE